MGPPGPAYAYCCALGVLYVATVGNLTAASSEFSGYISRILRNYTVRACDGEYASLKCPHRTTISIQSSFYGRNVPSHQMCPTRNFQSFAAFLREDVSCSTAASLQKMLDECQDRRICQILVNSRLFGSDPCPETSKYLVVSYKCRPNEYKSKVACEDDRLRLSCKRNTVIAIYSVIFGRVQGDGLECPYPNAGVPTIECQSVAALPLMTKRCQGRRSCIVYASINEFGDPCYPGVRKHLNVIYTCVPKKLLSETQPKSANYPGTLQTHFPRQSGAFDRNVIGDGAFFPDPAFISERTLQEKKKGRAAAYYPADNNLSMDESQRPVSNNSMAPVGQISTEMALISNVLAAYSFISENPERAALYFVSGVCIGLILTLLALVIRISCQTDCKRSTVKKTPRRQDSDSDSSDSDDDSDTTSDLSARRHRRFERTLNMNVFTSAEELERAQRLEERERIIREIWMNGQPDIPGTRSLNRYY
ncbi:protein eva-1 homolog A isoform X2 [Spea bombifrons]|uniref:protein eva-1 homolog A isoform X2 n=2 Tax=Spea bombifrons TaxID=233779 RepID=UPI00234B4CF2|nr:protein eva-1 homolog A isoform X2 [Spea bombifrons]